jgi:hypothetical protein
MDQRGFNETVLTAGLLALGLYFSVLLAWSAASYLRFRRLRSTALVTWAAPRPAYFRSLVTLGVVSALVAALNSYMDRPIHHVVPQGLMSLYFVLMVPLMASIPLGLYQDGVWAEAGFVSWQQIGRMAFRESPEIVLILLPRTGTTSFRLRVPPGEYGAVRKTLEDKVRERVLQVDRGMLDL